MSRDRQLKLSQLQALISVVKHGSFGEAALRLGMSQSAISHAIATLEAELGVVLLARGRYGAHPTPVGARIAQRGQQVMQLIEEIVKEANLERSLQGGQVRIAAFRSVATHILPEALTEFRRRYPAVAISINEHEDYPPVEEDLRKGRADLGFTLLPTSDDFETWEILQDEYIVLFPPGYEYPKETLDWEHLKHHPLIMATDCSSCDTQFYEHCLSLGQALQATYQFRQDSTIVSMVAQGLGVTVIPRLAAEPIPAGVKIFSLPVPLYRVIGVATLANAILSPAVFAFLDLLKENASSISK